LEVGGFAPHLQHDDMYTSAVKGMGKVGETAHAGSIAAFFRTI